MIDSKLVRDKIPEIMADNGQKAFFRVLDKEEYKAFLENKLDEEVNEYHESKNIEELADILEVVYTLCTVAGYTVEQIHEICYKKHKERGGFDNRVCLMLEGENGQNV